MSTSEAFQAGLLALLPSMTGRIFTPGYLQNITRPYIVHQPLSGDPVHTHRAMAAVIRSYQVTIMGVSVDEVEDLAATIRTGTANKIMQGLSLLLTMDTYLGYEAETQTHQWLLQYSVME